MRLIYWAVGWLVGIGIGTQLGIPWFGAAGGAVGVFALARGVPGRLAREICLVAGFLCLGMLRATLVRDPCADDTLAGWREKQVVLRGVVVGEAEEAGRARRFPLRVEGFREGDGPWEPARSHVLVTGPAFFAPTYGVRLELRGTLAPLLSRAPGANRFCLGLNDVELVGQLPGTGGTPFLRALYAVRGWARGRLQTLFPEPHASLLVGILLGSRTGLPPDVSQAFARSGTSHILAISGWNITLVVGLLSAGSRLLPRRWSLPVLLAGIAGYTILVGGSAAVVRAAWMGSLYLLARQVGRPEDGLTALFASAWVMTLWDPRMLADIGFQLSCTSTLGMLLFVPIWTDVLHRWPEWLRESGAATLASQLLTWPVVALHFRTYSLVVPLANLLGCPALAPLMLLGALALCFGRIPLLGPLLCGAGWVMASYLLAVVRWTGSLPWAALQLPVLGPAFVVVYYAALACWWCWGRGPGKDAGHEGP